MLNREMLDSWDMEALADLLREEDMAFYLGDGTLHLVDLYTGVHIFELEQRKNEWAIYSIDNDRDQTSHIASKPKFRQAVTYIQYWIDCQREKRENA